MKFSWFNDGFEAPRVDVYLTRRMARLAPRVDVYLTRKMARLGENIARNPLQFLGFSFLMIVLFSSGFQQLKYESDPGYLFVPTGARAFDEQNVIKKNFPNKMNRFVRGAEDSVPTMAEIAVLPLDGEEILRPEIWEECLNLVKAIETIQVRVDEELVMWNSVCAKFEGKCLKNDFLKLYDRIGIINFTYPLMTDPDNQNKVYPLLAHVGCAVVDDHGFLKSAKALKLSFIMDNTSKKKKKAGHILSQVIRMYASSIQFKHIKVYSVTDMTIEEELSIVIDSAIGKMPLTIVFVVAFAVYNCLSTDWVRSKPIIGVVSVIISGLSFTSASGLALYLGVPWQAINIICLPLTLGIGLDDAFVLLSAWWRSEATTGRDVVSRMSATYSEAAVSITVTSLTNVVSFMVGAAIPGFPAVKIFCFYAGLCMGILYFWSLFILGACLTLAGHLEHANRHCILLIKVDSKSEAETEKNWWYTVFLQGGVGKKDGNNPRDHKDGKFMSFFKDYLAPLINKPINKAIILVCFLAYLGTAIYGVTKLEEGLERTKLVGHASYAKPFFDTEDTYFRDNPYRFQIIIEEPLDYWNETVRNQVLDLIHQLEDSDYITSDVSYRQSWLHEFMQRVEENFLFFDISSQQKFVDNVIKFLEVLEDTPLYDDVIFSEDNRTILTSRFFLQSSRIEDATKEVMLLHTLRMIVDDAPFKATIFHPYFSFFDQFAQVTRTTMECVIACCICMTIITALFIPDKRSIIWVTFTILSVEVGIIGFMSLFGIRLDVISMIVIIMGIGFSVDFSAHISYHYLTTGVDVAPSAKVSHCLFALGPPIVRGGISTIIGVFGLYFHPSYITETFATMIFLIIFLGILHSLLLLPVLLSLFGPGSTALSASHIGLASPSQLSETFTYKASLTPKKLAKKKTDSLRRLVLSSGVRNNDVKAEPLDSTDSSLSSWYPNQQGPDFKNYVMQRVTSTQLTNVGELKKADGTYTVKNKPDPLPYYKFAHVKRGSRHTRFAEPTNNNEDEERLDESFDGENSWQDLQDENKK